MEVEIEKQKGKAKASAMLLKQIQIKCFQDCINLKYKELALGETICIQRCTDLYLKTHFTVLEQFPELQDYFKQT